MSGKERACKDCDFSYHVNESIYECRRNPPVYEYACTELFPEVLAETWCGEFKPKHDPKTQD